MPTIFASVSSSARGFFTSSGKFIPHSRLTRLVRSLAAIVTLVVLFYSVAGYLGSADMFGNHQRWRGINRGPAAIGLPSETVSFKSNDGIPLKAWWLQAAGMPRGSIIVAHGIDHTRQVMLPAQRFLLSGVPFF